MTLSINYLLVFWLQESECRAFPFGFLSSLFSPKKEPDEASSLYAVQMETL